jgi:hypothetical protein
VSEINWDAAPEGATHYRRENMCFYRKSGLVWYRHDPQIDWVFVGTEDVFRASMEPAPWYPMPKCKPPKPGPVVKSVVTRISIYQCDESPLFGNDSIQIEINDEGAGPFVLLRSNEGAVKIEIEELEHAAKQARLMFDLYPRVE